MQFRPAALVVVATLAVHGCTASTPRDATVQPVGATAAGGPGEIVCRDHEQTGTRFKKQKCRERSHIDEEVRQSRDTLRETLRKGANTTDPGVLPVN